MAVGKWKGVRAMQLLDVCGTGTGYEFNWPDGSREMYQHWVEYRAVAPDGQHRIRIGFGRRLAYGRERRRLVVWLDEHPHAEFLGADDFEASGDVLSEIKVPGDCGERICRYRQEAVPERYSGLTIAGLPTRVTGPGVHGAWAVVANIADHATLCAVAALRRIERDR